MEFWRVVGLWGIAGVSGACTALKAVCRGLSTAVSGRGRHRVWQAECSCHALCLPYAMAAPLHLSTTGPTPSPQAQLQDSVKKREGTTAMALRLALDKLEKARQDIMVHRVANLEEIISVKKEIDGEEGPAPPPRQTPDWSLVMPLQDQACQTDAVFVPPPAPAPAPPEALAQGVPGACDTYVLPLSAAPRPSEALAGPPASGKGAFFVTEVDGAAGAPTLLLPGDPVAGAAAGPAGPEDAMDTVLSALRHSMAHGVGTKLAQVVCLGTGRAASNPKAPGGGLSVDPGPNPTPSPLQTPSSTPMGGGSSSVADRAGPTTTVRHVGCFGSSFMHLPELSVIFACMATGP